MSLPKNKLLLFFFSGFLLGFSLVQLTTIPLALAQTATPTPTSIPLIWGVDSSGFFIKEPGASGNEWMRMDTNRQLQATIKGNTPGGGNMVSNPGFEDIYSTGPSTNIGIPNYWMPNWDNTMGTDGTVSNTTDTAIVTEGTTALALYDALTTNGVNIASLPINVTTGGLYTVSLKARNSGAGSLDDGFYARVFYFTGTGGTAKADAYDDSVQIVAADSGTTQGRITYSLDLPAVTSTCGAGNNVACTRARIVLYHDLPNTAAITRYFDSVTFKLSSENLSAVNLSSGYFGSNTGGGIYSFPGNVGIGTAGPGSKLHIYGGAANTELRINNDGGYTPKLSFYENAERANIYVEPTAEDLYFQVKNSGASMTDRLKIARLGAFTFFDDDGTTQRVTIDTTGNIGIGTAGPAAKLDVAGASSLMTNNTGPITINPNTNLLLVTSAGNVGIGTTGPGALLTLSGNAPTIHLIDTDTGADSRFQANTTDGGVIIQADVNNEIANSLIRFQIDGSEMARINSSGDLGIGTTGPAFGLDVVGSQATNYIAQIKNSDTSNTADGLLINLGVANASRGTGNYFVGFAGAGTVAGKIQGGASAVAYTTTAADYAEYFLIANKNDHPVKGDLVVLAPTMNKAVTKGKAGINPLVFAGVVSENPGFIGNGPICKIEDQNCDKNYQESNALVGIKGQVKTKVTTSNGEINVGDPITVSTIAGVGMKATTANQIVGYALENYNEAEGKIGEVLVLINPTWYDPNGKNFSNELAELKSIVANQKSLIDKQQKQIDELKQSLHN